MKSTNRRPYTLIVSALVVAVVVTLVAYLLLSPEGDNEQDEPPTTIAVTWVEVASPSYDGPEPAFPVAELMSDASETTWQAFVVRGDAAPERLFETTRWPQSLKWTTDGDVLFEYYTAGTPRGPGNNYNLYRGLASYTPKATAPAWDFRIMGWIWQDPKSDRLLVNDRSPDKDATVYLVEPEGTSRRLDGLGTPLETAGWSPDGRYVLVYSREPGTLIEPNIPRPAPVRTYYAVGPGSDVAIEVARTSASSHPQWSPDGSKLAFFESGEQATASVIVITSLGRRDSLRIDSQAIAHTPLSWADDSRHLNTTTGVIDTSTAAYISTSAAALNGLISPDGQRIAMTRATDRLRESCSTPVQLMTVNEVVIQALASGDTTVIADCDVGQLSPYAWLDDERLLLQELRCCHGEVSGYALAEIDAGRLTWLTDGLEGGSRAVPSPDNSRILVSGNSLRVYDASGALLREIEPPAGERIIQVAWSPDGEGFVYIVGQYVVGPI